MTNSITRLSTAVLLTLLLPAIAIAKPAASIQFNNDANTQWIPFLSYQALFQSLHTLSTAEPLMIEAMQTKSNEQHRQQLNAQFQQAKKHVNSFSEPLPLFKVFSGIAIELESNHQTYYFDLPSIPALAELNLKTLTIDSAENQANAVKRIQTAITTLQTLLPQNATQAELAKFTAPHAINEKFDSEFTLSQPKEAESLVSTLVETNKKLHQQLVLMLELAQKNTTQASATKQNQIFVTELAKFDRALQDATISLRLFTGNAVRLAQGTDSKSYQFFPISLSKFKLADDDLLTNEHALLAYQHTNAMFQWVNNWIFTGHDSTRIMPGTPDVASQYHSKAYLAFNKTNRLKKIYASND